MHERFVPSECSDSMTLLNIFLYIFVFLNLAMKSALNRFALVELMTSALMFLTTMDLLYI